jgi:hypothetical protein
MTEPHSQPHAVRGRSRDALGESKPEYVVGASLLFGCLLIVFFAVGRSGHLDILDSHNLIEGSRFALRCLGDGDFMGCGHDVGTRQTAVFPYPLLQYLPSGLLLGLGASHGDVLATLGIVSFMAFTAAILVVLATFRDRPRHGVLVVLVLMGSSAVYHATSAFGEGLVSSLVVVAACAGVRRHPKAIFIFVLAASIGKETLAPFVVALVVICARAQDDGLLPPRRVTVAALAAGIAGIALNTAFNVFRFGGPQNLLYLDPELRTPGVIRRLEFLSAIFMSPSSGVIWFWPLFSALALTCTAVGLHRLWRRSHEPGGFLPVLAVTALMMLWFAALGTWFSPFGWVAYGPRLEVPLLGGLMVAYVHTVGDVIIRAAQRFRLVLLSGVVLLLAGSLQLFAPWNYSKALGQLNLGGSSCPPLTSLDVLGDPRTYYRCVDDVMWRFRPNVFDDIFQFELAWSTVAWIVGLAACLVLWHYIALGDETNTAIAS